MKKRFRRWFEYEQDAHRKVLDSLHSVPAARRAEPSYQKAIDLLAHIVEARRLWLFRLGAARDAPPQLFPQKAVLEEVVPRLDAMHAAWTHYLEMLDVGQLGRRFEYQSTEGPRYRNVVEDILVQLFGHSLYHRGQIALLVRACGGQPAETDFVFWTREPVGSP